MLSSWNQKLFTIIHGWSGIDPTFDKIIVFCAVHLWWVLVVALVLFYGIFKRSARGLAELLVILFSALLSDLAAVILKPIVASPRPFEAIKDLPVLLHDVSTKAFPSGHTAFVFGLAVALLLYDWFIGVAAIIGALIVGLARVAAGVHWPIDIAGGIIVGALAAIIVHALASIFLRDRFSE